MTRIVDGKVEVYFTHQSAACNRKFVELSFSLEHYLLIASEAMDLASLRLALLDESVRGNELQHAIKSARVAKVAAAAAGGM